MTGGGLGHWAHGSKPSRVNHTGQRTFTATRNVRCLLTLAAAAARCPLCALPSMPAARSLVRPLTGALNHVRCLLIVRVVAVLAQARADVCLLPHSSQVLVVMRRTT